MTILHKYVEEHGIKPLSKAELKKGKDKVKIHGTDTPMPWNEVYTRISAGMKMEDIAEIYGNIRKIVLFGIIDKVDLVPALSDMLDSEIVHRRKMDEIEAANPVMARTMKEMANEYAPDVGRDIVMLSKKLVAKAGKLIDATVTGDDGEEIDLVTSVDLVNIAKAVQTMSDTIELTNRHSVGVHINTGNVQVENFAFELDYHEPKEEVIEAEVSE